jgi:hypothetical protein
MLLVCCEGSEFSGETRGCLSNTVCGVSRFSGIGPLVYAESWPSRNDMRSRRAWFGPLSTISFRSAVSGRWITCCTPQLRKEVGCIALSHSRSLRRQESHDISVSAFCISRKTSSLVSRVADFHPLSFTRLKPPDAGFSFAWRNMTGAGACHHYEEKFLGKDS